MPKQDKKLKVDSYQELKKDLQSKVVAHAWKNPHFKKQLVSNPKEALKELQCHVPENVHIKIIEETENQWTIVIPKVAAEAHALSEKNLSRAAGNHGTVEMCIPCSEIGCH